MINLAALLKLLPSIVPVVEALPEFKKVYDNLVSGFDEDDQAKLKSTYDQLKAENDEGHARLQGKLDEASRK